MSGKTALITGSTDGVGRYVALKLAEAGTRVILHGRNRERATELQRSIERLGLEKPIFYQADFASLNEVRSLADKVLGEHDSLHVLINNAGIGTGKASEVRKTTQEGYELRFGVNYLSGYLLTRLLLPRLRENSPSRIINVSSLGQQPIDFNNPMLERGYSGVRAYCQSKLAQILFTFDLAEELAGSGVSVNCLHPATYMDTTMVRESGVSPLSSVAEGGDAILFLATSAELEGRSGLYFDGKRVSQANPQAYDSDARKRLRNLSEQLVGARPLSTPGTTARRESQANN